MSDVQDYDSDSSDQVVFEGYCPAQTATLAGTRAISRNVYPSAQIDLTLIDAPLVQRATQAPPTAPLINPSQPFIFPSNSPRDLPTNFFAEFDENIADVNPPPLPLNPNRYLWPVPADQWIWNEEMTESWLPASRSTTYQWPIRPPQPYRLAPNYPRTAFPGGVDHHTQCLWVEDAVDPIARSLPPMQSFLYFNPNGSVRFKAHLGCSNCDVCGALTRDPYDVCTLCLHTAKHLMIMPYSHDGVVMNGLFANKVNGSEGDTIFRPTRPAPLTRLSASSIPGDIILSLNKLEIVDPRMLQERYGPSLGVYVWNNSTEGQDGTYLDGAINRVAASYVNACDPGQVPNCAFQYDPHRGHYLRCVNRNIHQGDALISSYNDQGRWKEMHAAGWRFTTYHGW